MSSIRFISYINNTMEEREKCKRMYTIFILSGLLCVTSFTRITTHDSTSNQLLDMMMVVLIVLLVCSIAGVCWKPFNNNPRRTSSDTNRRSSSRESSTSTSRPLVYADAPPSYEDILSVEVLEQPSGASQEDQAADKRTSNTLQSHILKPDLDEAESGTSNQHISPPRRYSPFIPETLYSYASASEIQLSVEQLQIDRLPNYEEAVSALQLEPTIQYEASTNYDMDSMFI